MSRGRPREFDREKALAAAMLLFWRKGFHATSLRDLSDALDIRMPSLYAAFGSKEALYAEAINMYMQVTRTALWQHLKGSLPARDSIRELLLATARELSSHEMHPVGCMVTLAMIDEDMPPAVATAIRNARNDWIQVIRERLESAVADGEIAGSTDLNGLSRFYAGIVQSIGVQTHDDAPYAELESMINIAMKAWPEPGTAIKARRVS